MQPALRAVLFLTLLFAACGGNTPELEEPATSAIPAEPDRQYTLALESTPPVPAVPEIPASAVPIEPAPESEPQPEPVPEPEVPVPVESVVEPVPEPVIEPVIEPVPPELPSVPSPAWVSVWSETWNDAPKIAGWTRFDYNGRCPADLSDPGSGPRRENGVGDWTMLGSGAGGIQSMSGGQLVVAGHGFALLSGPTFDHEKPIRASMSLDLAHIEGAWVGLTIHTGDANYREIGLTVHGGVLRGIVHTPCYVVFLEAVAPGPRELEIEYDLVNGWILRIDGIDVYNEPIDYRGNRLQGRPNVGIFVVNLETEQRRSTDVVKATMGPVLVQSY